MKNKIRTKILKTNEIQKAADILKSGGLVAFPTETVYGLGANALSEEAIEKIFTAKGRPQDNPLIVHIADLNGIYPLVTDFPLQAQKLAEKFWPGPLSLVLPASEKVPKNVTAGLSSVAIRMPEHPIALELISKAGLPIAAPSANLSGKPSPTEVGHVLRDLEGRIEAVVDGGSCSVGVESTVLDLTTETAIILRPGGLSRESIEEVIGKVKIDTAISSKDSPRSPGMKYTHYSPQGEVFLVSGHGKELAQKLELLLDINNQHELKTAFLVTNETASYLKNNPHYLAVFENAEDAAHKLYTELRKCDDNGIDIIYSETYKKSGIGLAIMNRLRKAAGGKMI